MPIEEACLLRAARAKEESALESLFRLYVEKAIRLAFLITRDWDSAEDAVQEAFVRAFNSLGRFHEGKPFAPWFTRIVLREALRVRRKWKGQLTQFIDWPDPTSRVDESNESIASWEEQHAIREAVMLLKELYRFPLLLKYVSGFSEKEIAEVLHLPLSTVKSRLFTARQILRARLLEGKGGKQTLLKGGASSFEGIFRRGV